MKNHFLNHTSHPELRLILVDSCFYHAPTMILSNLNRLQINILKGGYVFEEAVLERIINEMVLTFYFWSYQRVYS